ncbi:MAG: dockerin type I domain-containing protein [Bacillota bacterium]|nr:dockerin type I domain-containing protein [Bacillota bacterium]
MKKRLALMLALVVLFVSTFGTTISFAFTNDSYTWKTVPINGGGFVTGAVYNPSQNGLLYVRTDVGGAYRWEPSSKSWTPLMDGYAPSDDMGVLGIATDPTDVNRVYMMTGLYTQSWAGYGSFCSSTDKGATWTKTKLPVKVGGNEDGRNSGERLQVDPNLSSTLYMGTTKDGLYKSTDYGKTWNKITTFTPSDVNFVCLDKDSSSSGTATKRIIVGTNSLTNNLYMSEDGGTTWNLISGAPSNYSPVRFDINSGVLYVTYAGGDISYLPGPGSASSGVIYKYSISDKKWTNITPAGQGTYFGFGGISVDSKNPNIIVAATLDCWWPGDMIFRSTDGGKSWTEILRAGTRDESKAPWFSKSNIGWIATIQIDPYNSDNAIFTTGGGVFMTNNLSSSKVVWSYEDSGLEETCTLELKSPPTGTNLISALGDVTGFKHDDLTKAPTSTLNGGFGNNECVDYAELAPSKFVRAQNVKVDTAYGSYSNDGGSTWTEFKNFPSDVEGTKYIAISADGSSILVSPYIKGSNYSTTDTYFSKDNGSTWTKCTGLPQTIKPVSDRVNPNKFYAFDCYTGIVYISTDGGATFSTGASNLPTLPSWLSGEMRAVFGKEGHLWITSSNNGLYYSTDSGKSFTQVSNVTEAYKVGFGKAAVQGGYPAIYIVGIIDGTYGFFRSNDQGASWTRINDDAHQFGASISVITGDPKVYGRVYLGVGGRGIKYGDISGSSSVKYGDINGDNKINVLDYLLLKRYINNTNIKLPSDNSLKAADLNGDSKVDSSDYVLLRNYLIHKITQLPVK